MNSPSDELDTQDQRILTALQADGRQSIASLAEQLNLSETPCWRRVRRLENSGHILGYQARLDRRKLGYGVLAFAQISFGDHAGDAPERFEREIAAIPEILGCHNVSGECDYLLQIVAVDLDAYGRFVRDVLRRLPGVTAIRSNLALREVKASQHYPIPATP